jgi:acetyl-CoA carboxylase biotin carboxyl carrier protein
MPKFSIDEDAIRKLAALMDDTGLNEIAIEEGERRLRVSRGGAMAAATPAPAMTAPAPAPAAPAAGAALPPGEHPGAVKSPMVGTAYLQGEPGAPPFISVGQSVKPGDTLLIIEAMKIMNPIKATSGGTITRILVKDAQPVEFGEPLLIIE